MGRRTWVKLYCSKWLHGSIRRETQNVRDIFSSLLTMAGDSEYGDIGEISLSEESGLIDEQFAVQLNVPLENWLEAKKILANHPKGEIENRIIIESLKIGMKIKIIKWSQYQGEYERQKPYRGLVRQELLFGKLPDELHSEVTSESYSQKLQREGEGEGDIEGEREREKTKTEEKRSGEETARDARATAPSSEFVSFSKKAIPEIIGIFKKNGFPELAKNRKLIDYVSFLCFENLDFDHEDVIAGKLAHYRDKPPKKRANLCLAFKNWFSIERRIHEDRKRNAFSPNVGRRKK